MMADACVFGVGVLMVATYFLRSALTGAMGLLVDNTHFAFVAFW